MAWDIALSEHGDLVFAANRDLEIVEGTALLSQRIITRLRMIRGAWMLDRESLLGSNLRDVLTQPISRASIDVVDLVREALIPMSDDIEVQSVQVSQDTNKSLLVIVNYNRVQPDLPPSSTAAVPTTQLSLTIGGDT